MAFPRLSKLTDALYPITFLDMLAFYGNCFKAILLQAGRMLVGLLTNGTAPPSFPTTLPPSHFPSHHSVTRSSPLLPQGPPLILLHSHYCLSASSAPWHSPSPTLSPPVSSLLNLLWSPLPAGLLPLTFPVCCLNSSLWICLVSDDQLPYPFP